MNFKFADLPDKYPLPNSVTLFYLFFHLLKKREKNG